MKWVDLSKMQMRGLLSQRANLTYSRLDGEWYRPHEIFVADKKGWPGDWEGRTILALTLLAQATHRTPAWLDQILEDVPKYLNKNGHFGLIPPEGKADEQQVSGHSWFLRGLVEYYQWQKDPRIMGMIDTLLGKLFLPTRGLYHKYPIDPKDRDGSGVWDLSQLQTKLKTHAKTIDTGCAFIPMDGITQAYALLRTPELKSLIEEMIARYTKLDFVGLQVQTHATLSAARALLRHYESDGNPEYLAIAKKIFDFYKSQAWTEDYSNWNWFGRPRWTEACAIIDSFIVATWLWKATGDPQYLEDAHHIFYNGMSFAHRASGGFGSARCLGSEHVFLRVTTYEVYWCCTMRGGEGWHKAHEFTFAYDNDQLVLPFYHNCTAEIDMGDGAVKVKEKTDYPYDGKVSLEVLESTCGSEKAIKFFAPSWTDGAKTEVMIDGKAVSAAFEKGFLSVRTRLKAGMNLSFDLNVGLHTKTPVNVNTDPSFFTFRHGPMMLWADNPEVIRLEKDAELIYEGRGKYQAKEDEYIVLTPIYDPYVFTQPDCVRQALFMPKRQWK